MRLSERCFGERRRPWSRGNITVGHQAVIDFMGGVDPTNVYLLEPGGADAAYEPIHRMCMDAGDNTQCWDGIVKKAQAGESQYYRGNALSSCDCGQNVRKSVSLYYGRRGIENKHSTDVESQ